MSDIIYGPVVSIIEDNTFKMEVTYEGAENHFAYGSAEKIRIVEILTPELGFQKRKLSKEELTKYLLGRDVKCYIKSRDTYGRIEAGVVVE